MESAMHISEEWSSLSGAYTAEEADFMNQLLSNCTVPEQFYEPANNNFVCFLQGSSSGADNSNIFPTTSGVNCTNNPVTNFGYMPMGFSLGDSKFNLHSVQENDSKHIADNNLQTHKERQILVTEPEEDKIRSLEKPGKRSRSSNEVPRNNRNVKSKKNTRSASSISTEEDGSSGPQDQTCCSDDDSNNASQEQRGGSSSSLSLNDSSAMKLSSKSTSSKGAATDPQSVYARVFLLHCTEKKRKNNERLRILQNLVPNGTKVDISTMLDEAVQYVKFLQLQIKSALEEQLERVRNSVDHLQNKLRVGLEIENHLKKRVNVLEKKQISMGKVIEESIADLKHYHFKYRDHIMNLLSDGESSIKSIIIKIDERVRRFDQRAIPNLAPQRDAEQEEDECRDVHISPPDKPVSESKRDGPSSLVVEAGGKDDASDALAMALQEKVATLLLLSQQEERHLLERNVNSALQTKAEELQSNLLQVTNEKVTALMELAQLKKEHQLLLEKLGRDTRQGKGTVDIGERKLVTHEREGTLKNLLKKSYLRRWIGPLDVSGNEVDSSLNSEGKIFNQRSSSVDFARMKIENATLKESMESMEHLTSSIHRLRLSLLRVKESVTCEGMVSSVSEVLDDVMNETKLLRTALGSSLPISWSVEADLGYIGDNDQERSSDEKIDSVSAAGLEMVELLIFAAQMLRDIQTIHVPDIEVL